MGRWNLEVECILATGMTILTVSKTEMEAYTFISIDRSVSMRLINLTLVR